ncbi:cadherin-related family member 5 isoform 1 precursor [Homo sapiens]|uniref:Cadherin-related family member 5 n=1 Tax=Homo sapiens TaxID=9606 RepID=CDHR5_HUMAN|nr:cadherin-related family member 5 isoform 1 precursor [Homo sapiens]Q9HBB8.3 RecName: Full=Cadherin-related family member 5; AltName: Full=Mu-protocadherin; AltName: Full=Mucin and cadherin-like protein; AltName: Full=Mucin-like protocadherin; Short=MLPCDH; Flags: Precursor [Homo sapiens]
MGSWALLWPPLLFTGLLVRPPGTMAQAQYCSVNKDIFEVEENTNVTEPLVDIHVPEGQEVTLGALSTPFAFRIQGNQLFLNVTPDYEEKSLLEAQLLCQSGGTLVTQLRVFVSVLDVNDNAPEFPFKTKEIRVEEDTKVNSTVIPETQLQAEDRDKDDILFYTLQEMTAGASDYFSLVSVNRPALRLDRPLDFYERPNMTFWLLVRDTPGENVEPSHTATATLVLNVVPADLRPPWFLPCTFSDGYVCIQAQYHGAVPTGHILPSPLVLRPGPIYAEDGDRGINQPIIYSIFRGNVNGTFIIHPDSGNLTVARSVPSPMTFLLLVKGQQADLARYSVTQVTVEAVAAAGSPPRFPQRLYRGTVARGAGAGVVVKDAAAPSQPLRIQAQDPEFSDLNSAITYRITNHSHFRMEGEVVLTTTTLAQAGAFYAEVEAHNTVTSGTATTVIEIQVSEQEPPSTDVPPSPEAGGTTGPWTSTTSEVPRPPEPSQGPSTTSSGGGTGPHPPSGTTLRPPTSSTPGGPPGAENSTSHQPATPGGDTAQTPKPGTSQPMPPGVGTSTSHQPATPSGGTAQTPEPGTSQPMPPSMGTSTSHQPATPGGGTAQTPEAGTSQPMPPGMGTSTSHQPTTPGGGTAQTPEPGTSQPMPLSKSTPSSGGGPSEDKRFSVVDMAALGGVLGALLLLALLGLAVLVHKHYGPRLKCCCGKAPEPQPQGFDNQAFLPDHKANWAPVPSPTHDPKPAEAPMPAEPAPPGPASPGGAPEPPAAARAGGSPTAVRSILTKERRPEGGYKAVWFGEDIGTEADVVVLNAPTLDVDGASDSGSGDEGEGAGRGGGPYDAPGGDDSYI